jgi:hypothetical protein
MFTTSCFLLGCGLPGERVIIIILIITVTVEMPSSKMSEGSFRF